MIRKLVVLWCICLFSAEVLAQDAITKLTFEEAVKIGLQRNVTLNLFDQA